MVIFILNFLLSFPNQYTIHKFAEKKGRTYQCFGLSKDIGMNFFDITNKYMTTTKVVIPSTITLKIRVTFSRKC